MARRKLRKQHWLWERLRSCGEGKPLKGLIIASPSNPTGTILSPPELKAICDFCSTNSVRMISDEIYHGITIEGENACALSYNPHSIVINSFSKYFSMTGWRLGWVVCQDADFNKRMEALLQNLFISAPTLSQQAGIAAFDSEAELQEHVQRYKENAKILSQMLQPYWVAHVVWVLCCAMLCQSQWGMLSSHPLTTLSYGYTYCGCWSLIECAP